MGSIARNRRLGKITELRHINPLPRTSAIRNRASEQALVPVREPYCDSLKAWTAAVVGTAFGLATGLALVWAFVLPHVRLQPHTGAEVDAANGTAIRFVVRNFRHSVGVGSIAFQKQAVKSCRYSLNSSSLTMRGSTVFPAAALVRGEERQKAFCPFGVQAGARLGALRLIKPVCHWSVEQWRTVLEVSAGACRRAKCRCVHFARPSHNSVCCRT